MSCYIVNILLYFLIFGKVPLVRDSVIDKEGIFAALIHLHLKYFIRPEQHLPTNWGKDKITKKGLREVPKYLTESKVQSGLVLAKQLKL